MSKLVHEVVRGRKACKTVAVNIEQMKLWIACIATIGLQNTWGIPIMNHYIVVHQNSYSFLKYHADIMWFITNTFVARKP